MHTSTNPTNPLEEMLEFYFYDFLAFFFPEIHREIDWQRGYSRLDHRLELPGENPAATGHMANKLIKVWHLSGEERIFFIHLDLGHDTGFAEHIFRHSEKIFDRDPVMKLAVLGDAPPDFQPESLCCLPIKLEGYKARWLELELSTNPYATLVMAHLKSRAACTDPEEGLRWKIRLVRRLYEVGYQRKDLLEIFGVLDWFLQLPEALELEFVQRLKTFEEKDTMRYITSVERMGFQLGRREGGAALLNRQLLHRFDPLPAWVVERLENAEQEELESWAERVLDARHLEEVFAA